MAEFESIYNEYFKDVYLFLLGISGDEQIAEEITEETFFKALKAIHRFRGECDIRVWLCQIAKNEFYMYLRRIKQYDVADFSELEIEEKFFVNIEQQLIDSEMSLKIHKVLHELPEPYKEVFQLRVFGELSFDKIGEIFGKSANWACVTFHRARQKIQKELEEDS